MQFFFIVKKIHQNKKIIFFLQNNIAPVAQDNNSSPLVLKGQAAQPCDALVRLLREEGGAGEDGAQDDQEGVRQV